MFLVAVVCSDPECIEERELVVGDLDEVDRDVCDCGHGFAVMAVSELHEPAAGASVVSLPKRQRTATRRAA